ncbi:MAG: hypothetical protein ABFD23_05230 [Caldisericales bacterium]|nr:hypothetical protein [bacterium]
MNLKILCCILVATSALVLVSCGGSSKITWNDNEQKIYDSFVQVEQKASEIFGSITKDNEKKPSELSKPVWDWAEYKNSQLSETYKEWRMSAGKAIEDKIMLMRSTTADPQHETLKGKIQFETEYMAKIKDKIVQMVEKIKKGEDPGK